MGYFYADKDNFEDVQQSTGTAAGAIPSPFFWKRRMILHIRQRYIEDAVKKGCIPMTAFWRS